MPPVSTEITRLTGAGTSYPYVAVPCMVQNAELQRWISRLRQQCSAKAKRWNSVLHTQHLARYFLALRFIAAATVMLASEDFAARKNLLVMQPYLRYYALLSMLRAYEATIPSVDWPSNIPPRRGHEGYINVAVAELRTLQPALADRVARIANQSRMYRNMLSYAFPLSGVKIAGQLLLPTGAELADTCITLAELAQVNSECMSSAMEKFSVGPFSPDEETIRRCYSYDSLYGTVFDENDWYRALKIEHLQWLPNLYFLQSEGWVDDLIEAWAPSEEAADQFDLSSEITMLFPFH